MFHSGKLRLPIALAAVSAIGTIFSQGAQAQLLASNGTGTIFSFNLSSPTPVSPSTYLNLGAGNNIGGIAAGADGNLYIGDVAGSTNEILKYNPTTSTTTLFATLAGGSGTDVSQIAFDAAGNLYAATRSAVQKVTPTGAVSTLFTSGPDTANPSSTITLNNATGLAYNGGFVYVGDASTTANSGRIIQINATAGTATAVVNSNYASGGYVDPGGIAIRSDAGTTYLYSVAYGDTKVQRRTTTGGLATFDATGGPLVNPTGDLFDGNNNLFVADTGNNRLVEYNANLASPNYGTAVVFGPINSPRYLSLTRSRERRSRASWRRSRSSVSAWAD